MTGPTLPSHRPAPPSAPSQSPERKDGASVAASAAVVGREPRSVVDAWRCKLRLHGDTRADRSAQEPPRRKRPSFIKTLFKSEHRSATSTSTQRAPTEPKNQTDISERPLRALRALPTPAPSASRWQDLHGAAVVGGRRVPFTRDAHRRLRKKRSLASIAEAQPTQSSAEAYRRRAYYTAPPARRSKKEKAVQLRQP